LGSRKYLRGFELQLKSEDIYRCVLDECADGFVVSDPGGSIISVNAALAKLVGKDQASLQGQPLKSIINLDRDGQEREMSEMAQKLAGNGGAAPNAVAGEHAGAQRLASVIGKTGAELIMPVSHVPITSSEKGSKKKANAEGYLTIVYILQANSLQQAQTDFVSTVSHELRTPLTSIKGFADTILRAGDRLDVSQQRRYVGIIKDQADRLTRLVEDLLAVSRLESKRLQLTNRAIDLQDAVERVHLNLAEKAEKHRLVIDIPAGLPPVWADADRLEQILTNLIDNAIKYSPARTTVTLAARTVMHESNDGSNPTEMVEFLVSDQGVGIPEEHLPKIFHKFSRLDNPLVRQTEGTGLGLYITRSLALALGGDITVTSGSGGSTFTVCLPAATYEKQAQRGRDLA
jgi:two-component system phosphate regulon sensor histidine kinase PhoR